MSARTTRYLLLGTGWVGLLLAFMPFYQTSGVPRPPEVESISEISLPIVGAIPQDSSKTKFTIGLPFSPWFRYEKVIAAKTTWSDPAPAGDSVKVTPADGQPAPRVTVTQFVTNADVNVSWNMPLPNWSIRLAVASIALLIIAHWMHRRSEAVTAPSLTG